MAVNCTIRNRCDLLPFNANETRNRKNVMDQYQSNSGFQFESKFYPSGIIMLDGLRRADIREKQTGRNIYDRLRDLNDFASEKILIERYMINSGEELRKALHRFTREFPEDFKFILHLECHGSDDGIEIGDIRESVTWGELMELVVQINLRNKCNVGLVLACCNGFDAYKVDRMDAPVPFYFQLSHRGNITAGVLEDSLNAFYNTLLTERDIVEAIKNAAPFQMKYAEEIFAKLMYSIAHAQHRGQFVEEQINSILTGLIDRGGLLGNLNPSYNRKEVKARYGTFEKLIHHQIESHLGFFCGRAPGFSSSQLAKWIAEGKTLL